MLIREALAQGGADLKYAGIKTPGLDASLLLAHILNTNRTKLIAKGTDRLSEKKCAEFCALIERRANGECAAYIIGKKEFRELEFEVNTSVLVPRPETETLVETAIDIIQKSAEHGSIVSILDLCTGSGAVAISLKNEMPACEITAADISPNALNTAIRNAEKLLGNSSINFFQGDLYDALSGSQPTTYSLIVSNPPYIPSEEIKTLSAEVQNEPLIALDGGISGLEIIERIIEKAPDYLQKKGFLLLEADPRQMDKIKDLLEKKGFLDIQLYKDLSGANRVIGGRFEK
ncbi:peptide chain release factor N(5)-glutamine methyltransferase [Treponema sp. R80B11-R83G3]